MSGLVILSAAVVLSLIAAPAAARSIHIHGSRVTTQRVAQAGAANVPIAKAVRNRVPIRMRVILPPPVAQTDYSSLK